MTHELVCALRVTAHEPEIARVSLRKEQFQVGRPLELDPASPRIGALEYALGALAAEIVNGLRHFAWRRRLDVEHAEALITGELSNSLSYLEVADAAGAPRIARIDIKVFVACSDEAGVRRLWSEMLDRLPLLVTLRGAVPIHLDLVLTH